MPSDLAIKRHTKYFNLTLGLLPPRTQKEDSNKLVLVYCSLGGLSLLGYDFTGREREEYTEFIYSHLVHTGEGFRGSHTHELPKDCAGVAYDPATIANTYSALCCLVMLGEDFSRVLDTEKIMGYVKRCQTKDGCFKSQLDINGDPYGDGDLRQCYMSVAIRKLLRYDGENDVDLDALERYVLSKVGYDGGLGDMESHAGYTFCGLAALKLIGRLRVEEWEKTVEWLAHRQIGYSEWNNQLLELECFDENDQGGHNGRDNKFGDTCYSFWCSGSLSLLDKSELMNFEEMRKYLLDVTQNSVVGGFGKTEEDNPDPYHSFLALAALSLIDEPHLKRLDPALVIRSQSTK